MSKKRKKKKYRIKSSVKRFFIYFTFFIIMTIYTIKESYLIYLDFEYKKTNEYKLIQIGYSKDEVNSILNTFEEERINFILNNEYNEMYYKFLKEKYYLHKNLDKYLEYKKHHEKTTYQDVIAIVNVHANEGWYNKSYPANTSLNYLILVNKFYYLENNFIRDDIKNISLQYSYANNKAALIVIEEFERMREDVLKELDVNLMVNSSFRPYKDQEEIYNEYKKISQKYADSYAARPGYSEHQTGLAIDITSLEHPYVNEFKQSEEYEWLKNNCYKYGFILRYPENKEHITGYNTESWHFRYVGNEVAKVIHNEKITFDEYYAYYIEK